MKKISAYLALLCITASAQALQVHNLELKETPPLKPLNTCKGSDGVTRSQIEPCGPGETAITGYVEVGGSDSTAKPAQSNEAQVKTGESRDNARAKNESSIESQSELKSNLWKRLGKWLGFALVIGLVAIFLKRSFFVWFILGLLLRMVLVALNVMQL
ncbi:hypothetical protein ACO0LF_13155 [Undibacterium sp. Di27W]|uniref:hypothetical protein n=1 Tax=Undibacterium sp. Di27W TaxID=3413036 RepID=UPI003BEF6C05